MIASGINDAGQVAGILTRLEAYHAFITGPDGMGMRDLGTLGGMTAMLLASTTPGRWRVISCTAGRAITMLSSPAPMGWA